MHPNMACTHLLEDMGLPPSSSCGSHTWMISDSLEHRWDERTYLCSTAVHRIGQGGDRHVDVL